MRIRFESEDGGDVYLDPKTIAAVYWKPHDAMNHDALVGVMLASGTAWNLRWYGRDDIAASDAARRLVADLGVNR